MIVRIAFAALTVWAALLVSTRPAPADDPRPVILPLRDEEDWRSMRDPANRIDPLDALKYLPLDSSGDAYVTLSAEIREWYEHYNNQDWNAANGSNGYLLPRYLLGADVHDRRFHAFVQLESAAVDGRRGGPGTIFRDDFDATDAYVAYRFGPLDDKPSTAALLAGRQELDYGVGRVISARDGAGVRQSFDGVRAILRSAQWRVDAFTMHPDTIGSFAFDDAVDPSQTLSGVYAQRLLTRGNAVEAYILNDSRAKAVYGRGAGPESRWTVGARVARPLGRLAAEAEATYQFGTFGMGPQAATIAADSFAGSLSYRFGGTRLVPTLAVGAGFGSGDTAPGSNTLRTYIPPSFRGSYLGYVQENGPANSTGLQPTLALAYANRLTLTVGTVIMHQATSNDSIYNLAGFPFKPPLPGSSTTIGGGPIAGLSYIVSRHATVAADYQRFFAGAHFDGIPGAAPITYDRLTFDYKL